MKRRDPHAQEPRRDPVGALRVPAAALPRWAYDSYACAGGHALSDEDIDAALTFFSRAKERLPSTRPCRSTAQCATSTTPASTPKGCRRRPR
jgi:hypothetical protein